MTRKLSLCIYQNEIPVTSMVKLLERYSAQSKCVYLTFPQVYSIWLVYEYNMFSNNNFIDGELIILNFPKFCNESRQECCDNRKFACSVIAITCRHCGAMIENISKVGNFWTTFCMCVLLKFMIFVI